VDTTPLIQRIENREAVVGIIGLGYVGLPLAMTFGLEKFSVLGFDIDPAKVNALNAGQSYIEHIPASGIASLRASNRFEATTDFARTREADALLICVPTPLTEHHEPDLSYIENTAQAIAPHLRTGQIVILESTTYPGTTEEVLLPALEKGGLRAGTDFLLAYSPEREDPGNPSFSTRRIPKVVGGATPDALTVADCLYRQVVVSTVPVSNAQTAEAVKLLENIFRSVNIALVNELKLIYSKMNIDIWEVIEAAKTKPFGFMPFYPGPGLGGHCIPIDPFYLTWKAREYGISTRFIELAGEINTAMPEYVVNRLMHALNEHGKALKGARVLLLGMAYKPNVGDSRESPGLTLIDLLRTAGAEVDYNDPYIPSLPRTRKYQFEMTSVDLTAECVAGYDAVLVVTAHDDYDWPFIVQHARLVLDTRNATQGVPAHREKIHKA